MTATVCAFCGKASHMTPRWASVVLSAVLDDNSTVLQAVATCDNCAQASLARATVFASRPSSSIDKFNATLDEYFEWFPRAGSAPEFPDVPRHIESAAKEAHAAHSINAHMAAILMARTVVEATAKEKGVTKGNLIAKIDEMSERGMIRADTKEAAHEIRHLGNDMAHGDIDSPPERDDAADVLVLMNEILREVFQGPAVSARLRSRRSNSAI